MPLFLLFFLLLFLLEPKRFLRFFHFTAFCLSLKLVLLSFKRQCLLSFCADTRVFGLLLDNPLHSLGIDSAFLDRFSFDRTAELEPIVVFQQKFKNFAVCRLCSENNLTHPYRLPSDRSRIPIQNGSSNNTVRLEPPLERLIFRDSQCPHILRAESSVLKVQQVFHR